MNRVLVVEDEQHLAEGLRFNLDAEGYQVTVVETGEGALELLTEEPREFDLMVLDVMLPGKDGFTVMSELRAAGQFVPTADADRARASRRRAERFRGGSRRLSDQAVRSGDPDRADSWTIAEAAVAGDVDCAARDERRGTRRSS